jgi:hypothetical protein
VIPVRRHSTSEPQRCCFLQRMLWSIMCILLRSIDTQRRKPSRRTMAIFRTSTVHDLNGQPPEERLLSGPRLGDHRRKDIRRLMGAADVTTGCLASRDWQGWAPIVPPPRLRLISCWLGTTCRTGKGFALQTNSVGRSGSQMSEPGR